MFCQWSTTIIVVMGQSPIKAQKSLLRGAVRCDTIIIALNVDNKYVAGENEDILMDWLIIIYVWPSHQSRTNRGQYFFHKHRLLLEINL